MEHLSPPHGLSSVNTAHISLLCVALWNPLCVCVRFHLDIELSVIRSEYFYYLVASVFRTVLYDCGIYVKMDEDLIDPKLKTIEMLVFYISLEADD